ncbi:F-BAR and double SH3 domains protein 1, partial [Nibea albiflora]
MGLCTSKSTVTLDPSAHTLSADRASRVAGEGVSPEGTPILDEGILKVQPVKSKADGGGGGGGPKSGAAVSQTAKGYLELGGKGGVEGEAQTSREAEEEDEDEDGDEVEELINFSDSEGSLRSESFSKQRAAIEKEYGQALQRLAVQYQKRDWQRGNTDAITSGVFGMWRSVVDATAQSAASRLAATEEYRRLIGQASRSLRNAKDIRTKRQMDGDVYEDLRSHFTLLCRTEMDTCLTIHKQYSRIWESVAKVSALQEVCAAEAEGCLVKEAKKWATKAAKDYKIVTHGERALQTLESRLKLLSGETGLSVEQKIAEVQDSVRKAKEDEFELTDFEDYDDENGDIFADPVSASGVCVYPAACRVIYSYQASQSDELSIMEGEELQVIEDGDMEDWLKVCNSCGQVGYVPERYVQFLCLPAEDTTQLDSSFSSTSSIGNKERATSRGVARALYSYQAQSAEELSFQEGALIHLIRCRHGEVDDGFWEGELNGHIGVFPSLVVEIVHDEGEEEEEDEEE